MSRKYDITTHTGGEKRRLTPADPQWWNMQIERFELSSKHRMRRHARRRTEERFGVKLSRNLRGELLAQIASGRAKHLATAGGRTRWLVIINGQFAVLVFNGKLGEIATVFPA